MSSSLRRYEEDNPVIPENYFCVRLCFDRWEFPASDNVLQVYCMRSR